MSRSIGDLEAHSIGVICRPEITSRSLLANSQYLLVLGSDGLWEHISNEEVMEASLQHDSNSLAGHLAGEAQNRWRANDKIIDPISINISCFAY